MASLHKDPYGRSPYLYVAYRRGDGVRAFKSTKETDPHRASIVAHMMVRVAEEENRRDTTKTLLNGIVQDTLRRLGIESKPEPTIRGFLEQWLQNEKGSVSEISYAKYDLVIRQFLESLGGRAGTKISQVNEADIIKFRDHLQKEGKTPKTINQVVRRLLKRPFKMALAQGLISMNPVATVRALKSKAANKACFTLEQVQSLLSVAKGDWEGLILGGFYSGQRLSDLARLRWSNVDLDRGCITLTTSKTQREMEIPIHDCLKSWLQTHKVDSTWVFVLPPKKRTPNSRFLWCVIEGIG
jgi:integrase